MTEQNGGGAAILDADGDGQLDLFLNNGSRFDKPAKSAGASQTLFRQISPWKYQNVTETSRLTAYSFGMGCAAGDFNNDGFTDLYTAGYGSDRLWQNQGDGTFSEVSHLAGLPKSVDLPAMLSADEPQTHEIPWSSSAAWADLDGDGNLDLYIVRYVKWSPTEPACYTQHQPPVRITCGPLGRKGQPDLLFRNGGDGTFRDVTPTAGINQATGKGLDVAIADLDEDGRLDIYVANDTTENDLFLNQGQGRFENVAVGRGVAVGRDGMVQSGMGIACGDFNHDGHFDLGVTNFENEVNEFYLNLGSGYFKSVNADTGLNGPSRPMLGFGMVLTDLDLDHYPELLVANGHVWDLRSLGLGHKYQMSPQLFWNERGRRFRDVSKTSGNYFVQEWLGRSIATGDLDRDGDMDLVFTHIDAPVELLRNDTQPHPRSTLLRLIGTRSAREPRGCRVEYVIAGRRHVLGIPSGGGYQASSDLQILLAIETASAIEEITLTWPDGTRETWRDVPAAPALQLVEGTGSRAGP